MGVQEERKRLFGLRRLKASGTAIMAEHCLTCAHFKKWTMEKAMYVGMCPNTEGDGVPFERYEYVNIDRGGKKRDGSCLLIGGAVHQDMVCNKYRSA